MASKPLTLTPIFNRIADAFQNQIDGDEGDDFFEELESVAQQIHSQRSSASTSPTLRGRATYPQGFLSEDNSDDDTTPAVPAAAASSSTAPRTPTKPFKSSLLYGSNTSSSTSNESTPSSSAGTPTTEGQRTPATAGPPDSPWSGSKKTPTALRGARHMLRHRDPDSTLIKGDKEVLEKGLLYLQKLPTPEREPRTKELSNIVTSRLENEHNARRVQAKALAVQRALCEEQSWVPKVLTPLDITLVDRDHLTTFHQGKGKHICPLNDPLQAEIFFRYRNFTNQVWAGTIRREKFSTFIPLNMSGDRYMTLVVEARQNPHQLIAKYNNKELLRIDHNGQGMVVECCLGEDGKIIKTVYPLFYFETYHPKNKNLEVSYIFQYDLKDLERIGTYQVPYQLILELLNNGKLLKTCCIYATADAHIFDIALLFNNDCHQYGRCPVEQGVYVKIPKKYLILEKST